MSDDSHTRGLIEEAQKVCLQFDWRTVAPPDRLPSYFARLVNRFFKKCGYTVQDRAYIQNV